MGNEFDDKVLGENKAVEADEKSEKQIDQTIACSSGQFTSANLYMEALGSWYATRQQPQCQTNILWRREGSTVAMCCIVIPPG